MIQRWNKKKPEYHNYSIVACSNGTFGRNCAYNCSGHCLNEEICDKKYGICKSCSVGWENEFCNKSKTNQSIKHLCFPHDFLFLTEYFQWISFIIKEIKTKWSEMKKKIMFIKRKTCVNVLSKLRYVWGKAITSKKKCLKIKWIKKKHTHQKTH